MLAKKVLNNINTIFLRLMESLLQHPMKVIALITLSGIVGFLLSFKITQSVAIQDLLEPKMQSTKDLMEMQQDFGSTGVLLATFKNVNKADELCKLEVAVNEVLLKNPEVRSFQTPLQIRETVIENNKLLFRRLTPNPCESKVGNPILKNLAGSPWGIVLTNKSGTDYTVVANFNEVTDLGPFGHFQPQHIESTLSDFSKLSKTEVFFSGSSVHDYFSFQGMQQSRWLNIAACIILLLGLRLFIGTWKAGIFYFVTLAATMSVVLGGMAMLNHPIDLLTGCLFLMIMISTLQDYIFLSCEKMENPKKDTIEIFRELLLPSFLTSLTTFVGFSTLMISDLSIIKRFGMWAALGSMAEWAFVFLIVPVLLKQFGISNWTNSTKSWRPKIWANLKSWAPNKILTSFLIAAVLVPAFLWSNLEWTQTPSEMFPPNHIFQKSIRDQELQKGWVASVFLQFESTDADLIYNTVIPGLLTNPAVAKVETWKENSSFLLKNIADEALKRQLLSQIQDSDFGRSYITPFGRQRAFVFLKTTETKVLNSLSEQVGNYCPKKECKLVGEYIGFADFSTHLIKTLFESLFLSLILVMLIILFVSFAFGVKQKLALLTSIIWGPFFVMSYILISSSKINVVTCIVASILIGLAGDNAIQFLFAGKGLSTAGIKQRSSASMLTAVLMTLLSFVFLFSYFQPPRDLGILLAIGFLANLTGDLWILEGLLGKNT